MIIMIIITLLVAFAFALAACYSCGLVFLVNDFKIIIIIIIIIMIMIIITLLFACAFALAACDSCERQRARARAFARRCPSAAGLLPVYACVSVSVCARACLRAGAPAPSLLPALGVALPRHEGPVLQLPGPRRS